MVHLRFLSLRETLLCATQVFGFCLLVYENRNNRFSFSVFGQHLRDPRDDTQYILFISPHFWLFLLQNPKLLFFYFFNIHFNYNKNGVSRTGEKYAPDLNIPERLEVVMTLRVACRKHKKRIAIYFELLQSGKQNSRNCR